MSIIEIDKLITTASDIGSCRIDLYYYKAHSAQGDDFMTKTAVKPVAIEKTIVVLPHQVKALGDNKYQATKVQNLTPSERSNKAVTSQLQTFYNETVTADSAEQAQDKLTILARQYFPKKKKTAAPEAPEAPKKETKQPKTKATVSKPKADKPKAKTGDKPKKTEPKSLATFKHFLEHSQVKCLPVSPDNKKVTEQALKYFEAYNLTLTQPKLDKANEAILKPKSDYHQSANSLLNRDTIRILITETDSKNKPVASYLLKPLYISPYSIACVSEAHTKTAKAKSIYQDLINADYELTCYDMFNFNPLEATLTTSETDKKSKNKVTYQFVNVVHEARQ
jgi:hypothetical protein